MTATAPNSPPAHASLEDRIRERAYQIWLEHGRPHGNAWSHWFSAKAEVIALIASPAPTASSAPAKPVRRPTLRQTVGEHRADPDHRFHAPTVAQDSRIKVAANEAPQRVRGRHFDNAPRPGEGRAKPNRELWIKPP